MPLSGSWPAGVGRVVLPEVDSTNLEAARRAPELAGPTWILTLRQTKGRARRGRAWHDQEGNFAATYVLRPEGPADKIAQRSFVASLALHEALVQITGCPEAFGLKWPNDVLLHGKKLAGILLETVGRNTPFNYLAIGIGVNLHSAPAVVDGAQKPVNLKTETGCAVAPEEFLDMLAPSYDGWERKFCTYGFAPIRAAWLDRAVNIGKPIVARSMTEIHEGTFEGLDGDGALVLRGPKGRHLISAADVYFPEQQERLANASDH